MSTEDVVKGYTEALLWANTMIYSVPSDDPDMEPELEPAGSAHLEYDLDDFSAEDQYEIRQFVKAFIEDNVVDYDAYIEQISMTAPLDAREELFGHDLLLTRSGHGAGFWDRGLGELGYRLSEAARVYGDTSAVIENDKPVLFES